MPEPWPLQRGAVQNMRADRFKPAHRVAALGLGQPARLSVRGSMSGQFDTEGHL